VALLRTIEPIEAASKKVSGDERTGMTIVMRALQSPARQIADNSGKDGAVVVSEILAKTGNFGYDARRDEYCDLVKAGIIDPAKVVRSALQNAGSVAGLLLTTDVMITEWKGKDEDQEIPGAIR
ncbi:MAG: chaperonin GroEL, partial [Planctomycetota bacterium]|nr:chaperonin GroEL [Planctomycetota bacterium]